ncbi:hypothetical protein HQ560_15470 [bacterium]|nr:hypothetical protein [bacterium]
MRRTTRRVVRRTTRRLYVLPGGCRTVIRDGVSYYYCGSLYYQPMFLDGRTTYVEVQF